MTLHGRIFWILLFLGSLPLIAQAGAPARRIVVDPVGRRVEVSSDPQRVVALAPSITEIVYALGRQDLLKGVSRFSDFPTTAEKRPANPGSSSRSACRPSKRWATAPLSMS